MSVVKKHPMMHIISFFLIMLMHEATQAWPSNTRNDPFPMYTTLDPQYFLYEREKQLMFGMPDEKGTPEYFMLSLSPFGQNANIAKTIAGTYCPGQDINPCATTCNNIFCSNACTNPTNPLSPTCSNSVEIGDIDGRWNMVALLAGLLPEDLQNLAPAERMAAVEERYPLYYKALTNLFPGRTAGTLTESDVTFPGNDQCVPLYGYVAAPVKYRKKGIRWDLEAQICGDWGFQFQGGIVEISQVLNRCLINLAENTNATTNHTTCTGVTIDIAPLKCNLFDPLVPLMRQLGLDICNFTKWGVEDLYFSLYWRHAYVLNYNRDLSWARALAIPFLRFGVGAPSGRAKEQDKFFSVPFGNNNGCTSFNLNAGLNFDFAETVEFGGEFGWTHFFSRTIDDYRVPTNFIQSSIFPFTAPITLDPGDSAYVGFKLAAYHFLDRLSFYAEWIYVHHNKDNRKLRTDDPAFINLDDNNPRAKCRNTAWRTQLFNVAFTYDISPNWAVGFLWQQPLHSRNTYVSTTALFTLNLIF